MKYTLFILFLIIITAIIVPTGTNAIGLEGSDVNVEMIPENPRPNESVYVTLTSYITDINLAIITWKINGKTESSGRGAKQFSFNTGAMNTTTTLDVIITTTEGQTITKTIKTKPSSVDIIWQSEGTVPPFYKGKTLWGHENIITFIALPHITGSNGVEISSKNLVYKWSQNGRVAESQSGYGRNTFTVVPTIISRPMNIQVEVTGVASGVGQSSIYVAPIESSVVLYSKHPLYGIEFQKALTGTVELNASKEIILLAIPFYFKGPGLSYKWSINNIPIGNAPDSNTQVFRQKEGVSGTSRISLSVENSQRILQLAGTEFNLKFGQ